MKGFCNFAGIAVGKLFVAYDGSNDQLCTDFYVKTTSYMCLAYSVLKVIN